jgi:lipid-binding SYLF domain-containing protein
MNSDARIVTVAVPGWTGTIAGFSLGAFIFGAAGFFAGVAMGGSSFLEYNERNR